ncbi:MAG TPA: radical SAM protein [Methylomusa anaerophila]|uniref:Antilisterial bacteriocin subtilosin biosynthesis protein AlbA n=1 Tax=Methylomusa anaerophila TaxID=1930071 RepID=A0A348AFL7_9FIRM|nr:radical SAM protein [Methylomusa anaerophila]BBB89865.1 antilisterial bacteriocin subtilosin biosynthesis protein AlbA [Methylomusa anaerophila]HML89089.1 radical SAM protein [Methylomusa anaerophila]
MYYRLQDHCALVKGYSRGAIYDFTSGKVYSINKGAVELLDACQEAPVDDLLDTSLSENKRFLSFFDSLTSKGLGGYFTDPPNRIKPAVPAAAPNKLEFLWLELTSSCNNKCLHCYSSSGPTIKNDLVPHERWLSLIAEARQAGADAIQFIGGEPLMYPAWKELVTKAYQEKYDVIEIFSNATLINDSCIEFFKKHNVSIATTIYASKPEVHDMVTQHAGSFTKTLTAIRKIIAAGIPLRLASIIMKANEHEAENIMHLYEELGLEASPPDVVRPTGRGDDKDLLPTTFKKNPIKPPFYTDLDTFLAAQIRHACLHGKIAVTSSGDVIPCIFARQQVCGNILHSPLAEILNRQSLAACWCTTKDHIEKCKDCEYRYACPDCRPLAQGMDPEKRWLAPAQECLYNPYEGKWEEKA